MRCAAPVLVIEFRIALPDFTAIFICGMPHLCAVDFATITAYDFARKRAVIVCSSAVGFSACQLTLNTLPFLGVDDCGMAVFNIVLGYFTLVDFLLFLKKIHGEV